MLTEVEKMYEILGRHEICVVSKLRKTSPEIVEINKSELEYNISSYVSDNRDTGNTK